MTPPKYFIKSGPLTARIWASHAVGPGSITGRSQGLSSVDKEKFYFTCWHNVDTSDTKRIFRLTALRCVNGTEKFFFAKLLKIWLSLGPTKSKDGPHSYNADCWIMIPFFRSSRRTCINPTNRHWWVENLLESSWPPQQPELPSRLATAHPCPVGVSITNYLMSVTLGSPWKWMCDSLSAALVALLRAATNATEKCHQWKPDDTFMASAVISHHEDACLKILSNEKDIKHVFNNIN